MEFIVLDSKTIGYKKWYLCKGNLMDYISTLKKDFSEFQIQRRIVKNGYLDNILETVLEGEPMPIVTLTGSNSSQELENSIIFNPDNIEILDGLQRTFRLWVFWKLCNLVEFEKISDYKAFAERLKESDVEYLKRLDFVNVSYLKKILEKGVRDKYLNAYRTYEVFFVIWKGLNDRDIIEKMLILNAGQRSVSSTHQFEILFLHYFDKNKLKLDDNIRLIRERDPEYFKFKRGSRDVGNYALSSIIIAIQSFVQAKPLRIAPANRIIFEEDYSQYSNKYLDFFSENKLTCFINVVYHFDIAFSNAGEAYKLWFGKDTTLSGLFAGLGVYYSEIEQLKQIKIDPKDFKIDEYNQAYSELSSVNVNVGQRVREAIYIYTQAILSKKEISWTDAFNRNNNYE